MGMWWWWKLKADFFPSIAKAFFDSTKSPHICYVAAAASTDFFNRRLSVVVVCLLTRFLAMCITCCTVFRACQDIRNEFEKMPRLCSTRCVFHGVPCLIWLSRLVQFFLMIRPFHTSNAGYFHFTIVKACVCVLCRQHHRVWLEAFLKNAF